MQYAGIMAAMIGVASVFIMFVVSWLINYMVQFMMKRRVENLEYIC